MAVFLRCTKETIQKRLANALLFAVLECRNGRLITNVKKILVQMRAIAFGDKISYAKAIIIGVTLFIC